jgi:hypothetical protein
LYCGYFREHRIEAVHAYGDFRLNLGAGDHHDVRLLETLLLQTLDDVGRRVLAQLLVVVLL